MPIPLRNRPRIPTPDVTKEVMDRENRLAMGMQNMGVIMAQGYQNEVPVLGALVLSPIQELDSGSVNNTLHAGQPGTTALAQAVLSTGGLGPMTLSSMGISQITLGSAPSTPRTDRGPAAVSTSPPQRATVTELPPSDRDSDHSASTGTPPEFTRKPNGSKRGEVYV